MENNYQTLSEVLKAKNNGLFLNSNGEYCNVNRYYINNTLKFQVIFNKNFTDIATRPAINSTSEKRILKLLNSENFKLV
jgi:hypothetical protein